MKRIEAIIRPERMQAVRRALEEMGHSGMTVLEVRGHGIQGGITEQWRGQKYQVEFLPKIWMLLVVPDEQAEAVVEAICDHAATGSAGDGKIFVSDLRDVVRVRTRQRGREALLPA